ncbi:hypothetical protein LJ739_05800 [Aestuariibacter halophilus]|uniref:Uncharacterized protein n=1 Tax=Fluctibacter halophilus TaxID=226011 RepID=A0ABS8G593_9ALTE|nr:hypothetical protein [Aestuariibacter halophilus]MCC2615747.1 hypothetical protein [Aestuariibacter halophilus]
MQTLDSISRWASRRFYHEGLLLGRAYMVINDLIIYINKHDLHLVEGKRLGEIHAHIVDVYRLGQPTAHVPSPLSDDHALF